MLFLSYRTVAMSRSAVVQPCSGNAQRRIIWSVYKRESERFGEAHKNSPCVDLPGGGHTKEVFMDLGQSFPIGSVERDLIISPTAGTDGRLRICAPFPIPFAFPLVICSCSLSLGAAGGCCAGREHSCGCRQGHRLGEGSTAGGTANTAATTAEAVTVAVTDSSTNARTLITCITGG